MLARAYTINSAASVLSPWKGYPVKQGRIIPKLVTVIFQGTLAHSLGRGIHAGTEHAVYPANSLLWLTAGRRPATVGATPRLPRLSQSRYGQLSFHWLAAASPPRTEMEAFFSYQLFIFLLSLVLVEIPLVSVGFIKVNSYNSIDKSLSVQCNNTKT